jgi:hypothetical protein
LAKLPPRHHRVQAVRATAGSAHAHQSMRAAQPSNPDAKPGAVPLHTSSQPSTHIPDPARRQPQEAARKPEPRKTVPHNIHKPEQAQARRLRFQSQRAALRINNYPLITFLQSVSFSFSFPPLRLHQRQTSGQSSMPANSITCAPLRGSPPGSRWFSATNLPVLSARRLCLKQPIGSKQTFPQGWTVCPGAGGTG